MPIVAWNVPLVSLIFLNILLVFPILLFPSVSLHWLPRKAFLFLLAILWNSVFRWVYLSFSPLILATLLFSAICKASSDNHFAFLLFFFLGMILITTSCTMSRTSIYSSSGIVSIISSLEYICHFHCIIIRELISVMPEWSSGFAYFLQFKSEFGGKEFMIWATVSSRSCFCWLYRASPTPFHVCFRIAASGASSDK